MAESSGQKSTDQNKSEPKGGLYIKKGKPVSAEKVLPCKLDGYQNGRESTSFMMGMKEPLLLSAL